MGVLAASGAFVLRSLGDTWLLWTTSFLAGFFVFLVVRADLLEIIRSDHRA